MASAAEIRNRAAKKLGLYGTGQTLRSEMAADIDAAYVEVYAELELQSLVTWAIDDDVPDALIRSLVALVAGARVDAYSVPAEKYARITRESDGAEDRIRKFLAKPKMGVTEIEEF
jgi:hypothetical protein